MDIKTACKILEIENISTLTIERLKKNYHMLALKNHPDKNLNTPESTAYFQQIHEAYTYILKEIDISNIEKEEPKQEINNDYIYLVSLFIGQFIKGITIKKIMNIMNIILSGWKEISLQLFDELDKEKAFEIYNFICKYKNILHIKDEIIQKIQEILLNKFKNDKVFILNPILNDLMENNIYKLVIDEELYIVPLWHNELYFDNKGDDIIVLCIPELEKNISIDENNNIIVELDIQLASIIKDQKVTFMLGKKEFTILSEKLHIKKTQSVILKQQGISLINYEDIYNIQKKSDIIVKINIIDL